MQFFFIPGYDFILQPTKFSVGGVGYFIANSLRYTVRDDLNSSSDQEEFLRIEVQNDKNKNIVCGIIYRHPNNPLQPFLDNFYKTVDKIHKVSKLCVFMRDFNINLLNSDSHALTDDFINTLSSYSFQPHILHPTSITSHSATLIDNIFFKSLEYTTYSGNISGAEGARARSTIAKKIWQPIDVIKFGFIAMTS